jgi:hypothetical protein
MAKETKLQMSELSRDQQTERVRTWLSPPDPSVELNEGLKQRHEDTGKWFLESDAYGQWKTTPHAFLWLHARPGCGKTILASTIIEDLQKLQAEYRTILYFYFTFTDNEKQTPESMLRSFVYQMYTKLPGTRDLVNAALEPSKPSLAKLCLLFRRMVQASRPISIILDALDECPRDGGASKALLHWVEEFRAWGGDVRLLITSRYEDHIRAMFSPWVKTSEMLELESKWVDDDIGRYIHSAVRTHSGLKRWHGRPDIQTEIEETLTNKADGM